MPARAPSGVAGDPVLPACRPMPRAAAPTLISLRVRVISASSREVRATAPPCRFPTSTTGSRAPISAHSSPVRRLWSSVSRQRTAATRQPGIEADDVAHPLLQAEALDHVIARLLGGT